MKISKIILTTMLTAGIIMTTAIGAHAEGTSGIIDNKTNFSHEIQIDAKIVVPTIEVVVPTTSSLVLNPYKIKYGEDNSQSDQIISSKIEVINNSNVPVELKLRTYNVVATTTGADNVKPELVGSEINVEKSTYKYIALHLKDINSDMKVPIFQYTVMNPVSFGQIGTNSSMTLQFGGIMNSKATWTGEESVKITPVFTVNAQ